ncbi:UNVERIFIED_CONTAM: hypothetical protein HDU68_001328 [Siphonaria sp. JEL0065]|nr:hypothetical protein HDU68_001328 [Siphonaria sp. JEL0065]
MIAAKRKATSTKAPKKVKTLRFGTLQSHPFGVQPFGNALFGDSTQSANRTTGLGSLSVLDDGALLSLLLSNGEILNDHDLFRLVRCSKALYVLCNHEEVWRSRTIERFKGSFGAFANSWKNTYKTRLHLERSDMELVLDIPIKVGFYSDYLFSSWRCSSIPLDVLCRVNAYDNIDRRHGLSLQQFIDEYDAPGKPVILTDVVTQWPAFGKWDMDYLEKTVGDIEFRAESVDLPFKTYAAYARHCRENGGSFEEAPLYLFDKYFSKRTDLCNDFNVPEYFSQDLFHLLGANERPDYRWIIIGPPRSGSTYHLDPNSTSAWNAVITGSKKWLLFPPDCIPPGVFPSADGSEVTTPISLAEWFLNHYDEMKGWPVKPIECICRAGEILYVPRGWWHCVMNIEESIAITQNFVNDCNLKEVLRFVREKPDQVSGYGSGEKACQLANSLYSRFSAAIEKVRPGVVEQEIESSGSRKSVNEDNIDKESQPTNSIASLFAPPLLEESDGSSFRFSF